MHRSILLGALILGLALTAPARAVPTIAVTIGNAQIMEGGTGYVDVWIARGGTEDVLLSSFGFEFLISTGSRRLEFVDPQPDPQLTDSDYVFFNNSGDVVNSYPVGTVSTTTVPNDTFIGGDFTADFSNVTLSSTQKLLARLQVTTVTGLPPVLGDTFTISLVPDDSSFFLKDFDEIGFSSTSGTVTITAVPEPGSLTLTLLGVGGMLTAGLARRKRRS